MLFNDIALARRLEAAETTASVEYARSLARENPEAEVVIKEINSGYAVFAGTGSPMNQAKGLGMNGPVTESDLDELETLYHSRNVPAEIVVCPLADASLFALLASRGYRIKEFENELVLFLRDENTSAIETATSNAEVRKAEETDGESWTRIIAEGFFNTSGMSNESLMTFRALFRIEQAAAFLASIDGRPVGGGGMLTHEGVACLCGTSTLTEYRNRGVHSALIRARLESAAEAGCDLAKVTTQPGSGSQRNVERFGFRVAYTRVVMVRSH